MSPRHRDRRNIEPKYPDEDETTSSVSGREEQLRAALDFVLSRGPSWDEGDWAAVVTDMMPLLAAVPAHTPGALDVLLEWVQKQRAKPWAESGSFASRLTGQEGYDAALEEFEAQIKAVQR